MTERLVLLLSLQIRYANSCRSDILQHFIPKELNVKKCGLAAGWVWVSHVPLARLYFCQFVAPLKPSSASHRTPTVCAQILPAPRILNTCSWSFLGLLGAGGRGNNFTRHDVDRLCTSCFVSLLHAVGVLRFCLPSALFVDPRWKVTAKISWVLQFPCWKSKCVSSELWIPGLVFRSFACPSCVSGVPWNCGDESWA